MIWQLDAGMPTDKTRFIADTHAGNIPKIYGFYNNFCNVRCQVGVPHGQPAMTCMGKVGKRKDMNKYFA